MRSGTRAYLLQCPEAHRVRSAVEVDDMQTMRLLAREDVDLAVGPPTIVRNELMSGLLVEFAQLPQLSEAFFAVTLA